MPTNDFELQNQARQILDAIAFTPFEQCLPLSREFGGLPARPGIYAIRHKTDGLLYIGKTKSHLMLTSLISCFHMSVLSLICPICTNKTLSSIASAGSFRWWT
jgi:hypothetical protein